MITRRNFIVTSAAAASSPVALQAAEEQHVRLPLKAMPKVRTLSVKPTRDGRLLLFSDGPESPQKLIRPKALERAFGPGTDLVLRQPDHWRMIDEGWFAEEDLYEPAEFEDLAFRIWHANYRPETEAHDLLYNKVSYIALSMVAVACICSLSKFFAVICFFFASFVSATNTIFF